jgi:hypothetical protein
MNGTVEGPMADEELEGGDDCKRWCSCNRRTLEAVKMAAGEKLLAIGYL